MVFPQILGSILYTVGNNCYGRVESGGCWPLFPLQALALSGVGQAVDLGPAFQAAKEKNADNHKTEPLTWIYIYIFKTSENGIQRQNFENLRALYFLKL